MHKADFTQIPYEKVKNKREQERKIDAFRIDHETLSNMKRTMWYSS